MRQLTKLQEFYQLAVKNKLAISNEQERQLKLLTLNSEEKVVITDVSKESNSDTNLLKCIDLIEKLKNYPSQQHISEDTFVTTDNNIIPLSIPVDHADALLENNEFVQQEQKVADRAEKFFRFLSKYLKKSFFTRPFKSYQFVGQKHYLYFTIQVKPNNVFANLKSVIVSGDESSRLKKSVKSLELISSKNSSDYEIKFTRKNMKANVSLFLYRFLKNLRFLKLFNYGFIAINIISPKTIRKTILSTLGKSPFIKRFKGKTILLNLEPMKAFNGCKPKKITRKKRKKLRLYK